MVGRVLATLAKAYLSPASSTARLGPGDTPRPCIRQGKSKTRRGGQQPSCPTVKNITGESAVHGDVEAFVAAQRVSSGRRRPVSKICRARESGIGQEILFGVVLELACDFYDALDLAVIDLGEQMRFDAQDPPFR